MINFIIFTVGLVFGSFVAAYSYRYPRGIRVSDGFSFCDKCKRQIKWYENIPVLSYLLLRGKCSGCKRLISPRYPIIELTTALAFFGIYTFQSLFPFHVVFALIIYLILAMIFIIDFEHQIIPDDFIFAGLAIAVLYQLFFGGSNFFSGLAAGFLAAAFLMVINLLTRGRGMGLGDVKFAVLGGVMVGMTNLFIWVLTAFLTGAVLGIILILSGNAKLKDKIAFGPFLVAAVIITLIWGRSLISIIGI